LRAVKLTDIPAFILRRATLDEYSTFAKSGVKQSVLIDLLMDCMVEPSAIEARRALVERYPGLGLTCLPAFVEMRGVGAAIEKKSRPLGGQRSAT
jgi:hypothetical protein